MFIGWLTCIPAVLLPHSLCRRATVNAPANRQMPIASVVMAYSRKTKTTQLLEIKSLTNCPLLDTFTRICNDRLRSHFNFSLADNSSQIFMEREKEKELTCYSTMTVITTEKERKTSTTDAIINKMTVVHI